MVAATPATTYVDDALDRQRRGLTLGLLDRVVIELLRMFPDGCFTQAESCRVGDGLGASRSTTERAAAAVRTHTGLCEACIAGSVAAQR